MYREQMELLLKIIIFPFTSLEFYKKDYIKELADADSFKDYRKIYNKNLKLVLYRNLNKKYSLHTLDYIDMVIEKYYSHSFIKGCVSETIYLEILSKFAKSFICHRNGRVALKYWESENDDPFIGPYKGINKIALWNTLNRMMCTDILVMIYLLNNNMGKENFLRGYYSSIMLEDLQLEKVLAKGVAETHLHSSAGINFIISWVHLMNLGSVTKKDYEEEYLINEVYDEDKIQILVGVTAITRLLLVDFLVCPQESFYSYMETYKGSKEDTEKMIFNIVDYVIEGNVFTEKELSFEDLKNIWEYLQFKLDIRVYERGKDYVEQFLESSENLKTSTENIFLFKALKYIKQNKRNDQGFVKLFFQYIKVKNIVFQAKVQEDSINGLKNFQPYYKRSTRLNGFEAKQAWLTLMHCQFQNKHLKKLECRFGFSSGKNELKQIVMSFLEAYKEFLKEWEELHKDNLSMEYPPQIGLIFHMIKRLDNEWYDKCWQNTYDIEKDDISYQKELFYNANQNIYMNQIKVFNELRREIPYIDKLLIGIDAASIEDNTEPWVFAPVYQKARNSEDCCIAYESGQPMQTLGFTFHVGEDFRYILTGLRHIDEVLEHFAYHAGDRIGHGIALGVDTLYWCQHNEVVMIPRGEYLDDLLWIWGLYKDNKGLEYLDISYLEQTIMKQAEEIFGCIDGITVYMLWKSYQDKFNVFKPDEKFSGKAEIKIDNRVFCRYIPEVYKELGQFWSYEALKYVQHCRCYAEKLLEPIAVEIDLNNVNLYSYLQKLILNKINNRGIIIETNPTSNLEIGEIQDLFHHYIFNLNNLDAADECHRAIFSINSDDPSVFNTNVSNEISYIFYALQKQGYSREEVLTWIDKIRNYGMKSSFLQEDNISLENLKKRIEFVLKELKS